MICLITGKVSIVLFTVLALLACFKYESLGFPLPANKDHFHTCALIGSVMFGLIWGIWFNKRIHQLLERLNCAAKKFLNKNNETRNSNSDFDFDLNEILDTPDVKNVKGWETANEVLFLYYLQFKDQLETLTEPQRVFFLVNDFYNKMIPDRLDAGGFQTFFSQLRNNNSPYKTLDALQRIGAEKTFNLLQECINAKDVNVGEIETVFNKCTKKYLTKICKTENIVALCLEYVRQNKEHFRNNDGT
ncbi:MAG: DMP19 family protein [Planctomycetaceae bacterium]|nr:DMP19 family protein [Planctomycetaceae bacterium]